MKAKQHGQPDLGRNVVRRRFARAGAADERHLKHPSAAVVGRGHLDGDSHAQTGTPQTYSYAELSRLTVQDRRDFDRRANGFERRPRLQQTCEPIRGAGRRLEIPGAPQSGETLQGVDGLGGRARALTPQEQGGGVRRRPRRGAAAPRGSVYESGLAHRPRYEVDRASGTIIDVRDHIHQGGQACHADLILAPSAVAEGGSQYLRSTQNHREMSSGVILYPEFGIALHPRNGAMRSLSRSEKLWLSIFQEARSPSRPSAPKFAKAICARSSAPGAGSSLRPQSGLSSSSNNG